MKDNIINLFHKSPYHLYNANRGHVFFVSYTWMDRLTKTQPIRDRESFMMSNGPGLLALRPWAILNFLHSGHDFIFFVLGLVVIWKHCCEEPIRVYIYTHKHAHEHAHIHTNITNIHCACILCLIGSIHRMWLVFLSLWSI